MKVRTSVSGCVLFIALLCMVVIPCQGKSNDIPYRVANHYFVNNTIKKLPTAKVASQKEFDALFGCAPVMGKDGAPTTINFSKEYVIAVSKPETYYSTALNPISLKRDKKKRIVFTYRETIGAKQSYSIVPCLLIIVSKKEQGKVLLKSVISKTQR